MAFDHEKENYFEACGIADKTDEIMETIKILPDRIENSSQMTELMVLAGNDIIKNAALVCAYLKES